MRLNVREKTIREFDLLGLTELQMDTLRRAINYYVTFAENAPHENKQASRVLSVDFDKAYYRG